MGKPRWDLAGLGHGVLAPCFGTSPSASSQLPGKQTGQRTTLGAKGRPSWDILQLLCPKLQLGTWKEVFWGKGGAGTPTGQHLNTI